MNHSIDFWEIAANVVVVGFVFASGWTSGITRERRNRNNRVRSLLQLQAGLDEGRERLTEVQQLVEDAVERLESSKTETPPEATVVRAGDGIVLRVPAGAIDEEDAAKMKERWAAVFPDTPMVVLVGTEIAGLVRTDSGVAPRVSAPQRPIPHEFMPSSLWGMSQCFVCNLTPEQHSKLSEAVMLPKNGGA